MLEAGEDPKFIARRLIVFASEDVGLADPGALVYATAARQAVDFVGMPGVLPRSRAARRLPRPGSEEQLALRLLRPRRRAGRDGAPLPVPLRIRNAPTRLMRRSGIRRTGIGTPTTCPGAGCRSPICRTGFRGSRSTGPRPGAGTRLVEEHRRRTRTSTAARRRGPEAGAGRSAADEPRAGTCRRSLRIRYPAASTSLVRCPHRLVGLGPRPFKVATRVRIPLGTPFSEPLLFQPPLSERPLRSRALAPPIPRPMLRRARLPQSRWRRLAVARIRLARGFALEEEPGFVYPRSGCVVPRSPVPAASASIPQRLRSSRGGLIRKGDPYP